MEGRSERIVQPHSRDVSVTAKVEAALSDPGSCLLLHRNLVSDTLALLVTGVGIGESDDGKPLIGRRYVGAVRDTSRRRENEDEDLSTNSTDEDEDLIFIFSSNSPSICEGFGCRDLAYGN
ncbi:hypothetical protein CHU98_g6229 [Xylaria longipes]|nr:hypothetical protein CHU98_g6229 [Xylaria longipes]